MAEPFDPAHDAKELEKLECQSAGALTLPVLPAELILSIFEEACSDRNTAISISQTSKHYRDIFEVQYLRSVRFCSAAELQAFADSPSNKAVVRDMEFIFPEGVDRNQRMLGENFPNFSPETFRGCSGIRALSFQSPYRRLALENSFLSVTRMLQPTYMFFGGSLEDRQTGYGDVRKRGADAPPSVTHLAFSWHGGDYQWEREILCFESLTHLWIRLDMRQWKATSGRYLHDGIPILEARGIRVLLTIHDYHSYTEVMVMGILRRYVNPTGALQNLQIEVEPPDGVDFDKFNWANILVAKFAELEG
ncbi:hypothetical protein SISSUDRAFT_1066880 [Sistotremastrum suecicum HHB10207 ss-3]|uniref:F-box domain-containing protein n=1 Tax=Sistotremastrum suecicum HHB10207 ss-3 TaxID=1314776 RepID=A0A165XSJ9_9AGAM|nr:hypothetical protein SISSUDRAFT_1066880 [Sistotremastrum suecicum HHB10207 ss-3]